MLDRMIARVRDEALRAGERYGEPRSTHESLGVLLEEFDELKSAIHANAMASISMEAIQVAAVALRLAVECERAILGETDFRRRSVP